MPYVGLNDRWGVTVEDNVRSICEQSVANWIIFFVMRNVSCLSAQRGGAFVSTGEAASDFVSGFFFARNAFLQFLVKRKIAGPTAPRSKTNKIPANAVCAQSKYDS